MGTTQSNEKQCTNSSPKSKSWLNVEMNSKDLVELLKQEMDNLNKEYKEIEKGGLPRQYIDMRLGEIGNVLTNYSKARENIFVAQQQLVVPITPPVDKDLKESKSMEDNVPDKGTSDVKQDKDSNMKGDTVMRLERENTELRLRLSKVASEKLIYNNPHIADLSDPNRPTKVAEMYRELYDNEYTDATEGFTKAGLDRKEAVRILRKTLLGTYSFCQKKSKQLIKTVEDAVKKLFDEYQMTMMSKSSSNDFQDISSEWRIKGECDIKDKLEPGASDLEATIVKPTGNLNLEEKLTKLRKEVSMYLLPMVQKAYLKARWDKSCLQILKPFIKKCLQVTWCMVVMAPPPTFLPSEEMVGKQFDITLYSPCTKSGPLIDYVVWPALCICEGGPMLSKGVAEGRKE